MLKKICSVVLVIFMIFSMTTIAFGEYFQIDGFEENNMSAKKIAIYDNYAFVASGAENDATDVLNVYNLATKELVTTLALPVYETGRNYFVENMYVVGDYMYISWNKNRGWGDCSLRKYEIKKMLTGVLEHVASVGLRGDHVSGAYENYLLYTSPIAKAFNITNTDTNETKTVMNLTTLDVDDIYAFRGICADENYFYIYKSNEILIYDASEIYNLNMQKYDDTYAIYKSESEINSVKAYGGSLYVATKQGLDILTVSDGKIEKTGAYTAGGEVMAVTFHNNSAYIFANGTKSIQIINIADKKNPVLTESFEVKNKGTAGIVDILVSGQKIYAADLTEGFSLYSSNELDKIVSEDGIKAESYTEELALSSQGKAIELVVGLGIMKLGANGLFSPSVYITRGEFAQAASNLVGLSTNISPARVEFTDVPLDSENAEGIYSLVNLGIINGFGDGTFRPDEPILYEHAVKIMVKLLGYYPMKQTGNSSIQIASDLGILDKVGIMNNGYISRGDVARLIYNSLETKRMKLVSYGNPNEYNISKEDTLLAQMRIKKEKGQVTASEFASIFGDSPAAKGKVRISGIEYPEGDSGASSYIGRYVTYYHMADEEEENGEILFVIPTTSDEVITVDAQDISKETTELVFAYLDENEKLNKANIKNAAVIFNGKYCADYTASDLVPADGEVTLVDSDSDGEINVLIVKSYETLVVDGFGDNIFRFKYGCGELNIKNIASKADKILVEVDGTSYDAVNGKISGVKEWSVVSLLKSRDGKMVEVYVTNRIVPGMITGKVEGKTISVEYEEFKLSNSFLVNAANPQFDIPKANVGDEVYAYIDKFGKIATVSVNEVSAIYGYLISCSRGEGLNSNIAEFKVLVRDQNAMYGTINKYRGAERLRVNGLRTEDIYTVTELFDSNGFKEQIIKFSLNANGEIKEVFTAKNKVDETIDGTLNPYYEAGYIGYTEGEFTYDVNIPTSAAYRAGDMSTFEGYKYFPNLETDIFVVPTADDAKDEEYKVYDYANLFKSGKYSPGATYVYDVDSDYNMGAVVVKLDESLDVDAVDNAGNFIVVDSFRLELDESGEKKTVLVSAKDSNNKQTTVFLENDELADTFGDVNGGMYKGMKLTELPKGSVIQYMKNFRDEIVAIRILYIPTAEKAYFEFGLPRDPAIGYLPTRFYSAFAKVVKITAGGRLIFNGHGNFDDDGDGVTDRIWDGNIQTADRAWDRNLGLSTQSPEFYLYDTVTGKITTITSSDILPDDDIFIVKKSVYTELVVVYR